MKNLVFIKELSQNMKYHFLKILNIAFFVCLFHVSFSQTIFNDEAFTVIGRGTIEWQNGNVIIKDCFITQNEISPANFEMSFLAKSSSHNDGTQIWAGFGFQDRDNRYALGLRGGNNNDLYLCRYQSGAKNKMLALETIDFPILTNKWYHIKIIVLNKQIRVYVNNEELSRIIVNENDSILSGSAILGGGWIETEYKNLIINELSQYDIEKYISDTLKYSTNLTAIEKEVKRAKERSEYKIQKISSFNNVHDEISLAGEWLFMPDNGLDAKSQAYSLELNDNSWHIMEVPQFWNPVRNWLHLQDSKLPHKGSGISDNYREKEETRCNNYTFNSENTTSAWYRHWIELPTDINKKRISLYFSAVSKIAQVYVNGYFAGEHIGMFGDFELDITPFIHSGKNIIAVAVQVRKDEKAADANTKVTQAVSVDITNDMLNSLPHGMFNGTEGGIWQDVLLKITNPIHITEIFADVQVKGGNIQVELENSSINQDSLTVEIQIIKPGSNITISLKDSEKSTLLSPQEKTTLIFNTGEINPKVWSPENPHLYQLICSVFKNGELIDKKKQNIGFRTFESTGNKFYLNGKPYWLGGANHPPIGIAPNNKKLANTFFKLMHDGKQMATRSHGCPFTKPWMDAADKHGIGLSFEGTWPWLMISEIPSKELIDIWKAEMISLVKKYRNHPSLFIWTINNEMYFTMFYHNDPPEIRKAKWKILSDLIKEIRELSPNTLVSSDSGYGRLKGDYEKNIKPNNFDDGDIDDRHIYFNWYNRDFFQIMDGEWDKRMYWSPGANADRPFFSQETSTGYTNNDDGHFNRKYLFNNYVPQAWLGDWAYEDKNPKFTLQRHAFMTKELLEVIRRTSPESAGVLLFANVCWFKNVFEEKLIEPYPVYHSVKQAGSPVLISVELFGRSFFAGSEIEPRVCIINNSIDGKSIPPSSIIWEIEKNGNVLSSGEIKTGSIPHDDRLWTQLKLKLPQELPESKTKCTLHVHLKHDTIISKNSYELLIAQQNWITELEIDNDKVIAIYDYTGETFQTLDFLNINYKKLNDLTEIRLADHDLLIIANLDESEEVLYNWEDVKNVCGNGTNVLLIHPGKHLQWLYYDKIESIYERKGRVVNMHIPEHPAFDKIDPMELSWWQQEGREKPNVCRRSYRLKNDENTQALCTYLRPHTGLGSDRELYLKEMSGIPLLEIKEKKRRIIASEMELNKGIKDPIAAKLLWNIIYDLLYN